MTAKNRRPMAALAVLALLAAAGTATAQDRPLRIGSKIDTEGSVLCPLVRLALEAGGLKVEDRCGTGATQVVRKALLEGEIDMYPEYTGNAPYLIREEKFEPGVFKDAARGYAAGARADLAAHHIVWLKPAPANNTYAIAVTRTLAAQQHLATLHDLAAYLQRGGAFKLVASREFVDRDDALKAFEKAYGFALKPEQLVVVPGGNTAQTETAAARGTGGANAAMAYGTDGQLAALDLVALQDPLGAVVVYQPMLIVREAALKAQPRVREIVEPIFAGLDAATLSRLNAQVVVGGVPGAKVARDYLKGKGLLK